jgi:hypothetical protein
MTSPEQEQAIDRAWRFADTAHSVEVENFARETREKLIELTYQYSASGNIVSGTALRASVEIYASQIKALLKSRLELLLEGLSIHNVTIDDGVVDRVMQDLGSLRSKWIKFAANELKREPAIRTGTIPEISLWQTLENKVGMNPNEVKTQLERSRHMPKQTQPSGTSINVYHVHGNNNRWLTNSQDHSVNAVTQSSEQIFSNLRQEIESRVPEGAERQDMLERLTALEKADNTPSFKQRYIDFIAAAANHMTLIAPFIPALTELLSKAL